MTKQQEIREGVFLEIKYIMKADGNKTKIAEAECCTDTILRWQASKGVVIKVERAKSPDDFVAVEPLIGGK